MKRAFINGECHIFDEARTVAEAILVENGRIAKFGSSAEIKEAAPDAEFVDLNGRILLPAFIRPLWTLRSVNQKPKRWKRFGHTFKKRIYLPESGWKSSVGTMIIGATARS